MLGGLVLINGNNDGRNVHLHTNARIRVSGTGMYNGNRPLAIRATLARGTLGGNASGLAGVALASRLDDGRNVCARTSFVTIADGGISTGLDCDSFRSVEGRYD